MEQKFKLTNVVLYAKGWYKKSDDVWEDLKKILELDDYSPYDKMDVYNIILIAVQNSNIYRWIELREVLNGIHPSNCWKYGYYTKKNCSWVNDNENLPEYDMPTAFIHYILSNLSQLDREQWNVKIPNYLKYPKSNNITLQKVYEIFVKPKA